jgi:hypothetical protein
MSTYLQSFAHDLFPDERSLQAFSFVRRPVLAKLEQRLHDNSVGRTWAYPALIQASIAQGTTRAGVQEQQAQANDIANFDGEQFQLGYFPPGYKGGFEVTEFDMALTASAGGVPNGAYMENFAIKLREQPKEFGQRQERYFVGRAGKSLARSTTNGTTTNLATGVIQLADPLQVGAFRHAMILNISLQDAGQTNTPATSSLLGVGDDQKLYIRNLDIDSGRIFVSSTSGGALGAGVLNGLVGAAAFFIWNYTDFQGSLGYTPNVMPPAVQDWIPATTFDPSLALYTTPFFGVTRSRDSRLAGWRLPVVAGESLDSAIIRALERAYALHGADGTYTVIMSPQRWTQLTQIGAARGYRMLNGETATIGYRYIEIVHGEMTAECLPCPSMQSSDLFFLKMDDDGWCVRSLGGWPKVMNGDGLKLLRAASDDKYELRITSFFHFGVRGINLNGRADISGIAV